MRWRSLWPLACCIGVLGVRRRWQRVHDTRVCLFGWGARPLDAGVDAEAGEGAEVESGADAVTVLGLADSMAKSNAACLFETGTVGGPGGLFGFW